MIRWCTFLASCTQSRNNLPCLIRGSGYSLFTRTTFSLDQIVELVLYPSLHQVRDLRHFDRPFFHLVKVNASHQPRITSTRIRPGSQWRSFCPDLFDSNNHPRQAIYTFSRSKTPTQVHNGFAVRHHRRWMVLGHDQ